MSAPSDVSGCFTVDDPFALLGFLPKFDLKLGDIANAQVRALAKFHPDRHPEGVGRELAVMQSARINAATIILMNPLLRVEALVLLGDPSGKYAPLSPAQLCELLERRESMEACATLSSVEKVECDEWLRSTNQSSLEQLRSAFSSSTVDWVRVRSLITYFRALLRLSNEWARLCTGRSTEND